MSQEQLTFYPETKLRSIGWQGQLDQADRPEAVVAVARDYLAQIGPEEVAQLPEDCRPNRLVDADDVAAYAFQLARGLNAPDAPEVLHRLAAFFSNASMRASRLLTASPDDDDQDAAR